MIDWTHLDLFSGGCAGFTLGFEAAGFRTIAFSEVDKDACINLAGLYPGIPNVGDIRSLRGQWFIERYGWPLAITGGVPCQPASALGNMRGTADERWLWPDTIRVVGELRPWYFVGENPPAILTIEDGRAWNGIVSRLVALGYDLWWDVFPAAAFGAGHLRERVILVAAQFCEAPLHPDTDSARLEGHTRDGAGNGGPEARRSIAAPGLPDLRKLRLEAADWWQTQSPVQPVVNGLPGKLVEAALRIVGNSVLPHIPYLIGRSIKDSMI